MRTVALDWHGTCLASLDQIVAGLNKNSKYIGINTIKDEDLEYLRGMSAEEITRDYLGIHPRLLDIASGTIGFAVRRMMRHAAFADGMADVVRDLFEGPYRAGIICTDEPTNVRFALRRDGLPNPDFLYSTSSIFYKEKILARFLKREQLDAADVLYVVDELRDVTAAKKVGISNIVGVSWGYNRPDVLEAATGKPCLTHPGEIFPYMSKSI